MFSFRKFVFNHYSKPWILLCFVNVLLSVVSPSNAQGDPTRLPTYDERIGLILKSDYEQWPACTSFECGYQADLDSSTEEWCAPESYHCMWTDPYVRLPKFCSIARVEVNACPNQCTFGNEPRQFFGWINRTCADEVSLMENWREETMSKEEAWVLSQWIPALLPWNWTVQAFKQPLTLATIGIQVMDPKISSTPYLSVPPSGPGVCTTSTTKKLSVFAAVNIVSAALTLILGRRTVMNKLTFGYLGNLGSYWWPYIGVFFAALHLISNFLNAYVIHSTPGYENVPITDLALLWCTRPRLSWLAVYLAPIQAKEGMYLGSAASSLTCEAILQVLGAVYFGITANYGRKKGFYYIGHLDPYPRGKDAHIMYGGALLWLVMLPYTLSACASCLSGLGNVIAKAREMMKESREHPATLASVLGDWAPKWLHRIFSAVQLPRELTDQEIRDLESVGAASIIFVSFVAQWLFWAGFVRASQERYCPPKLLSLGIIWSLCSAVGTFLGAVQ